jgi:CHAD domain-containing protein
MTIEEHVRAQTGLLLLRLAAQVNRAARSCDKDAVHDLRVSIRRLSRCLRVFSQFYPEGSWKKIRRRLKTLMDTAGAVRDMDIAMDLLADAGIGRPSPVVRRMAETRRAARRDLAREVRAWKGQGFSKKWRTTLGLKAVTKP